MRRLTLIGLLSLAMGIAGCEPADPTQAPDGGSEAPLFDQGVDPAESQADLDD